jgi:hypothetical protein
MPPLLPPHTVLFFQNRYATRYVYTPCVPHVKGQGNGKSITLQGRGEGVPEGWGQGEGGVVRHLSGSSPLIVYFTAIGNQNKRKKEN